MYPILKGSPTVVSDSASKFDLGQRCNDYGSTRGYRYVKNVGPEINEGDLVYWTTTDGYSVSSSTSAIDGTLGAGNRPAGVAVGTIPQNYHGYVCVCGFGLKVNVSEPVDAGDYLAGPNAAARQAFPGTAGIEHCCFARALEADAGTDDYVLSEVFIEAF